MKNKLNKKMPKYVNGRLPFGINNITGAVEGVTGLAGTLMASDDLQMQPNVSTTSGPVKYQKYDTLNMGELKKQNVSKGISTTLGAAATGAKLGSIIPGVGTVIGGAIGAVGGALKSVFGAKKRRRQLREQNEKINKLNNLNFSKAHSDIIQDDYYSDPTNNTNQDLGTFKNGKMPVRYNSKHTVDVNNKYNALVAKGELIKRANGGVIEEVTSGSSPSVDDVPVQVAPQDSILSSKNINPVTGNSFAEDGKKLSNIEKRMARNVSRNTSIIGKNTAKLNQAFIDKSWDNLLAIQDASNKSVGRYKDGKTPQLTPKGKPGTYRPIQGIQDKTLSGFLDNTGQRLNQIASNAIAPIAIGLSPSISAIKNAGKGLSDVVDGTERSLKHRAPKVLTSILTGSTGVTPSMKNLDKPLSEFISGARNLKYKSPNNLELYYPKRSTTPVQTVTAPKPDTSLQPTVNSVPVTSTVPTPVQTATIVPSAIAPKQAPLTKSPTSRNKATTKAATASVTAPTSVKPIERQNPGAQLSAPKMGGVTMQPLAKPTSMGWKPQHSEQSKNKKINLSNLNVDGALGALAETGPIAYNLIRGSKKEPNVTPEQLYSGNPYESLIASKLGKMRHNPNQELRAVRDADARARYNARNLNSSGGLNRAYDIASAIGTRRAEADILSKTQNINNLYAQNAASVMAQLGAQSSAGKTQAMQSAYDINMRNKAAGNASITKAIEQLSQYAQNKKLTKGEQKRKDTLSKVVSDYMRMWMPNKQVDSYNLQ